MSAGAGSPGLAPSRARGGLMKQWFLILSAFLLAMGAPSAEKETGLWPSQLHSASIHFDNDLFVRTDR